MSNRGNELVGMSARKRSVPGTDPGYQAAGSYNRHEMQVAGGLWLFVLRHLARHYAPSQLAKRPARFAVIQSAPGEGKTESVRVTCSRSGVDVIVVSASELAGETENAGPAALAKLGEVIAEITAQTGRPLAVVLDDFDLSIVARLRATEYTVDSQLLTGALQHLADTGGMRSAQGVPVPIVMTGNDFTPLRSSLLRPGRAHFYEHSVSLDEKCAIVAAIFGVKNDKAVRALVAAHRQQPVAFFVELAVRAGDEDLDALIGHYGLNIGAIEAELADAGAAIAFDRLHKLAAEVSGQRATNFLGPR